LEKVRNPRKLGALPNALLPQASACAHLASDLKALRGLKLQVKHRADAASA
jgi:hypothetical protein